MLIVMKSKGGEIFHQGQSYRFLIIHTSCVRRCTLKAREESCAACLMSKASLGGFFQMGVQRKTILFLCTDSHLLYFLLNMAGRAFHNMPFRRSLH